MQSKSKTPRIEPAPIGEKAISTCIRLPLRKGPIAYTDRFCLYEEDLLELSKQKGLLPTAHYISQNQQKTMILKRMLFILAPTLSPLLAYDTFCIQPTMECVIVLLPPPKKKVHKSHPKMAAMAGTQNSFSIWLFFQDGAKN